MFGLFGWKLSLLNKPVEKDVMKAELEAKIADLQSQRDAIQAQLDTETAKFNQLVSEIPAEFHNMTQEVFDKLKVYFN